jgi:hypothetical protein
MIIFTVVVFMQRSITESFSIEDSLLSVLQGSLPPGNGGYLNSDRGASGSLTGVDDWYTWMSGIFDNLYTDAVSESSGRFSKVRTPTTC